MKVTISDILPRIQVKENKTEGILNYDIDNAYPQRAAIIAASSGTATRCIKTYAKFLEGSGFADQQFFKAVVNSDGLTADKLLRSISFDIATYLGLALHVQWNALFQVTEVTFIPFQNVRKGDPLGKYKGMFALYEDWGRLVLKTIKKDDIDWLFPYSADKSIIMEQVMQSGGWENYKGQIFYLGDGDKYPVAVYDSVLNDIDTDSETQVYRNTIVRKGFNPSVVLVTKGKFESEKEKNEFKEGIEDFQGPENAASIIHIEAESDEEIPELLPFPESNNDKKFDSTTKTTKDSIVEAFGIPPILIREKQSGGWGTQGEIIDAQNFYNSITEPERRIIEQIMTEIFSKFHQPVNPSNDYSIIPFQIFKEDNREKVVNVLTSTLTSGQKKTVLKTLYKLSEQEATELTTQEQDNGKLALTTVLGVGGTQSLTSILADPAIEKVQKVQIMIILFGLSKDAAASLVYGTPLHTEI